MIYLAQMKGQLFRDRKCCTQDHQPNQVVEEGSLALSPGFLLYQAWLLVIISAFRVIVYVNIPLSIDLD